MNRYYLGVLTIFVYLSAVLALGALSIALALKFAKTEIMAANTTPGMLAHIFISLIAMSFLILASSQALLMGFQNYLLKRRRAALLLHVLPPLQTMESLLFAIILGGTLLFSASMLSGFFFEQEKLSSFLHPKILLAVGAWVLLGFLLFGRKRFGWRGPTAVRWTLSATALALLSYFGTKALLL